MVKKTLQSSSTGESELFEAQAPQVRRGSLLIDTSVSLISTGTERMLVDFGKSDLVAETLGQPEKVRQVLDKVATGGLMTTVGAVRSKLGLPIPLGYCNVGVERAAGAEGFAVGNRVVSNATRRCGQRPAQHTGVASLKMAFTQ
ncbi:hypothetical protein N8540_04295 [Gammaproteobacteria bacterium]|nr:hypothetical protein [Gammaproteobacteria bacterium]